MSKHRKKKSVQTCQYSSDITELSEKDLEVFKKVCVVFNLRFSNKQARKYIRKLRNKISSK